jgi:hypothetical protein
MCDSVDIELARRLRSCETLGAGESAYASPLGRRDVFVAVAASCAFRIVPVKVRSACLYVVT